MRKYLDSEGLLYLWGKLAGKLGGKVDKETGKGLSSNDFTADEKIKLSNLTNYNLPAATPETLGGVKVGTGLAINQGVLSATGGGKADSVEWDHVENKSDLALKSDLSHVYRYRGSVTNFASLPAEDNEIGDVWNVETTGMNYAWTGQDWDALGQFFEIQAITNAEIDTIAEA